MAEFEIKSSRDGSVLYKGQPRYEGTYLRPGYLEFLAIASTEPIQWRIGDYIDYPAIGMTLRLYKLPKVTKQSLAMRYGGAFVYENVQFFTDAKQLDICPFSDIVPGDNRIHFSTVEEFSFMGTPDDVKDRIQACLDDMYPGQWTVRIAPGLSSDYQEEKEFSASGLTVLGALDRMYEIWPGLGWTHTVESGGNVLTIGGANVRSNANTTAAFSYGAGLSRLSRSVGNMDELTTRLYGYGSMRNMPAGYYKDKNILDAESVDIEHLMIPISAWGTTGGVPDPSKAYVENTAATQKYGLIPKKVYFDGSDARYPEIFPSLEGMTAGKVRSAKSSIGDASYVPSAQIWPNDARVDNLTIGSDIQDTGDAAEDGKRYIEIRDVNSIQVEQSVIITRSSAGVEPGVIVFHLETDYDEDCSATVISDLIGNISLVGGNFAPDLHVYLCFKDPTGKPVWGMADQSMEIALRAGSDPEAWTFSIPRISASYKSADGIWLVIGVAQGEAIESVGGEGEQSDNDEPGAPEYAISISGKCTVNIARDLPKTFTVSIPQIGFNIEEYAAIGDGRTMSMKSGMCAGRDFKIESSIYDEDHDRWDLTLWRSYDEDLSSWFPNSNFQLEAGDRFVLLDIAMPELYILAQSQRLLEEVQTLLADASQEKPFYEPEIDSHYVKEHSLALREGMYMHLVSDEIVDGGEDYALIDTLEIDESASNIPVYSTKLRMRKATGWTAATGASTTRESTSIDNTEYMEALARESRRLAQRSFMDAIETSEMLIDAKLDNFSEEINPIFINTMQMLVGSQSLQFRFIQGFNNPAVAPDPIHYDPATKMVYYDHAFLQHMTLGINSISASRDFSDYLVWELPQDTSVVVLTDPEKKYYIYAKCDALNDGTSHRSGEFIEVEYRSKPSSAIGLEDQVIRDPQTGEITGGYYHFLVGMLLSEKNGDRSFSPMYGFTEILPGQITTELIRSSDGNAYLDLARAIFRLGNQLQYDPTNGMLLRNPLIVTGAGNAVPIGAWCGPWQSGRNYSLGDEVTATVDGEVITYRWVNSVDAEHADPLYPPVTNQTYWLVVARGKAGQDGADGRNGRDGRDGADGADGADGEDGRGIVSVTTQYGSSLDGSMPMTWSDSIPTDGVGPGMWLWIKTTTTYTTGNPDVVYSKSLSGGTSPVSPFRGEYDPNETYYGSFERTDIVCVTDSQTGAKTFYRANPLAETGSGTTSPFSGVAPGNAAYWQKFQGQFDSLATGLAFIDQLFVWKLDTAGNDTGVSRIHAESDTLTMFDGNNVPRLAISGGEIEAASTGSSVTLPAATNYVSRSGTIPFDLVRHSSYTVSGRTNNIAINIATNGGMVSLPSRQITYNISASGFKNGNIGYDLKNYLIVDGVFTLVSQYGGGLTPPSSSRTITSVSFPSRTLAFSAGAHTISYYSEIIFSGPSAEYDSSQSNNYLRAYASLSNSATASISYPSLITEIGTNGFRVMLGSSDKMAQFVVNNNSVNCVIRSQSYGIEITDTGIRLMTGTTNVWRTLDVDPNDGTLRLLSS